jgi:hypothetical protein
MEPFGRTRRLKSVKTKRNEQRKEENIMKIRTKVAVFLIAVVLSLAGFGVLAGALSADKIMAYTTPSTEVGVTVVS